MGSFRKRSSAPENQVTMGIGRDSLHKRRSTGGRQKKWRKKRKHELGRIPAGTKISSNTCVRRLRVRGGNYKFRALRLDAGNWSWASEAVSRKTRVLDVTYNASNNGVKIGVKKIKGQKTEEVVDDTKRSGSLTRKLAAWNKDRKLDPLLDEQFVTGRLYACISSRPGQCGRCDGYILEGKELEFYLKKMQKKKSK